MAVVLQILGIFLGKNPVAKLNPPANMIKLPPQDREKVYRQIREALLQSQKGFRLSGSIAGLAGPDAHWIAAGTTVGVAVFGRNKRAGAVSILLSGLDDARERGEALAALAARRLPVPPNINDSLDKHARRPLLVNVFYDLSALLDPMIATVSTIMADCYFASLGVNVEVEDTGSGQPPPSIE